MGKSTNLMFWSAAGLALLSAIITLIFVQTQGDPETWNQNAGEAEKKPGRVFGLRPAPVKKPET